jgi:hypothetical protein
MKNKHGRLHPPITFEIGEIVALIVPEEYRVNGHTNKLPAIVVGYEKLENSIYYYVGVRKHVVEGRYLSHHLEKVNAHAFAKYLGIDDLSTIHQLPVYWGRTPSGVQRVISISNAYIKFISEEEGYKQPSTLSTATSRSSQATALLSASNFNPSTLFDNNDGISSSIDPISAYDVESSPPNVSNTSSLHVSSLSNPSQTTIPRITAAERRKRKMIAEVLSTSSRRCFVCDNEFKDGEVTSRCRGCFQQIHLFEKCEFSDVMEPGETTDDYFCSLRCMRGIEIYPEEILELSGDSRMKIKYNNGNVVWIASERLMNSKEYATIYRKYKNKKQCDPILGRPSRKTCMKI